MFLQNLIKSNFKGISNLRVRNIKKSLIIKKPLVTKFALPKYLRGRLGGLKSVWIRSVCFSPCGKLLASGDSHGIIRILDVKNWKCIKTLKTCFHDVQSLCFSPCGEFLVSGCLMEGATIILRSTWNVIRTLEAQDSVLSVCFSPCGKFLALGGIDKPIRIWDVKNWKCIETLRGHSSCVESVSWSPDGRFLASGSSDKTIRIWDVKNRKCIKTLWGHSYPVPSVCFSPREEVLVSGSRDTTIRVWDVKSNWECIKTLQVGYMVERLSFSSCGKVLAIGCRSGPIAILNANTWNIVNTFKRDYFEVNGLCLSPCGEFLASGGADHTIIRENIEQFGAVTNILNSKQIQQLFKALEINASVAVLDLSNVKLQHENIVALCEMLNINKYIISVDLSNVVIDLNATIELTKFLLRNKSLLYLNLRNTKLDKNSAFLLRNALRKNNTLKYFNIEKNNIPINIKNEINKLIARNNSPQVKQPLIQPISPKPKAKKQPKAKKPVPIPKNYRCPISLCIMFNPVITADGHAYEEEAIKDWFETGNLTSPTTGKPLPNLKILPNHGLRGAIRQFLEENPYLWNTDEVYESEELKKKLVIAIQAGNISDIKRYIAQDRRLLWKPIQNNRTLLQFACTQKNPDVLKAIIALLGDLFKAQVGNKGKQYQQVATKHMGSIGGKIIADALGWI